HAAVVLIAAGCRQRVARQHELERRRTRGQACAARRSAAHHRREAEALAAELIMQDTQRLSRGAAPDTLPSYAAHATCDSCKVTRMDSIPAAAWPNSPARSLPARRSKISLARNSVVVLRPRNSASS